MTALHWSAYNNTTENVRLLLKAVSTYDRLPVAMTTCSLQGADIVVTDMDGKTALHWTANNTDPLTVRALLELAPTAVNLKDSEGRTGLNTHFDCVLDSKTCSVCPALHLAVAAGNVPVIEALVSPVGVCVSELSCVL